jgi:non-heme chloroperoxidase
MVRLDLRGHGLSDKLADPAAFQDGKIWAEDIRAVISALRINKPVLPGWSYGGFIICDYIRYYGQENLAASSLWLLQPKWAGTKRIPCMEPNSFNSFLVSSPRTTPQAALPLQQFIGMATCEELDAHTFYYLVGFNSVTLPASRLGMFMRELDNGAVLEAIKVSSLIIQGKDDHIVLSASSDNIARHIPHVSRVDYDHCGNVPFVETAEQFNRGRGSFMQRVHG